MKSQIRWGTFFKLSLVVVSSIVLTNFCTIASSDWITKNLFIQSSTFLNAKLMDNIVLNDNVLNANGNLNGNGSGLEQWPPIGSYGISGEEAYIGTFDELLSRRRLLRHGEIY